MIRKNNKTYIPGFLLIFFFLFFMFIVIQANAGPPVNAAGVSKFKSLAKDYLYPAIEAAGTIISLLGVWKFGTAMSQDDAERLSKGVAELATGAVLVNLKNILSFSSGGMELADVEDVVKGLLSAIGIILALFGGLQLGIGISQGTAEGVTRGVKLLVAGIILAGATTVMSWIHL